MFIILERISYEVEDGLSEYRNIIEDNILRESDDILYNIRSLTIEYRDKSSRWRLIGYVLYDR